jgi:hypothetical protein
MRTSTAYFAGVGTVVAAVVAGLGGGLVISNIVSPHEPKIEMSKLELRMSKPIPATNASSEPAKIETATPTKPTEAKPAEAPAAQNVAASPPAASPPQAAAPVTQAATSEQVKTPEAAFAKANDTDVRSRDVGDVKLRDVDVRREARRAAEEKRRAERRQYWVERRQQWTERRRPRQDQELRDVEARVREETETTQAFASEPVRLEMPRIKLFGDD